MPFILVVNLPEPDFQKFLMELRQCEVCQSDLCVKLMQ